MTILSKIYRHVVNIIRDSYTSIILSSPKIVKCNICLWEGRNFSSDLWHKHINCPRCHSSIRQRLFFAALQHIEFANVISNKTILHFAPEYIIASFIKSKAAKYVTADYFRKDCDLKLDMSHMESIKSESFDIVIAFDVLEHVPDYQMALKEVYRVLCLNGVAIFTVPQQDNLKRTYEDSSIVSSKDRTKYFGQHDHLRIFGDDFIQIVMSKGFSVSVVDESNFPDHTVNKYVLFPPILSPNPLATNYRKVFICKKTFNPS